MSLIKLNNICVEYGKKNKQTALKDVCMEINDKEFVAVMGKSGCGKTTLLNVLGTLLKPQSGEYMFDGMPVLKKSGNELAQLRNENIGFVVQHFALVQDMTIYDNVALPLTYRKMSKNSIKSKVMEVLDELEIGDQKNKYPDELSGGQCQRAAIARAIITEPGLILADEPTGALDEENGNMVIDILQKLNEKGITIVMVTHDNEIAHRASRIVRMHDGRIV